MERGIRPQPKTTWRDPRSPARQGIAFIVGTLGVGIAITFALLAATETGWMERIQTALHDVRMPKMPSLPETNVGEVFQGVGENVVKTQHLTSDLLQRGAANAGAVSRGSQPGAPGNGR